MCSPNGFFAARIFAGPRLSAILLGLAAFLNTRLGLAENPVEVVRGVERQPFAAAVERLQLALTEAGQPLAVADAESLKRGFVETDDAKAIAEFQRILDPYCLAVVTINAESRVTAVEGPVKKQLVQQGWRTFLLKVINAARITPELQLDSPQAGVNHQHGKGARNRPSTDEALVTPLQNRERFLDIEQKQKPPLKPALSGLEVEYRIVHLFSRDAGRREVTLAFHVGQGTQDLAYRNQVSLLFECQPAIAMHFDVRDHDGQPTTAALSIKDAQGHVYPNPGRRLAPDFFFHQQIYRSPEEAVFLPAGTYQVVCTRGPEYQVTSLPVTVKPEPAEQRQAIQMTRWIHPRLRGWISGDHHVHAAGCAHYDAPTEGVRPQDMLSHIIGEDLNVGCVLTWGPCWYYQKQYFEGKTSAFSKPNYLMRYDVEVSGFPSSHAGHLCLLRLKEDDYPNTKVLEDWPSWTLPVLQWGKEQGAVVGYSHSGWGLALPDIMPDGSRQFSKQPWGGAPNGWTGRAADKLPDDAMPPFDGIGANEFVVTAAHDACDFISAVDTPAIWELNIWYHTLNCGLRTRISGETDFPCIYGDRVGLGRIYVKLPPDKPIDFDQWTQGVKEGRSYCTDGLSHLLDFRVNNVSLGAESGAVPDVMLPQPGPVDISCDVAALLSEKPTPEGLAIRKKRLDEKPYWHIERCRLGETRRVPVELIVNGDAVERREIEADGSLQTLKFATKINQSSWIALRILPSCHTNPIWVKIGDSPTHPRRQSAEWCRTAVDVCWKSKQAQIRESERPAAKAAYDKAAAFYEGVIKESP